MLIVVWLCMLILVYTSLFTSSYIFPFFSFLALFLSFVVIAFQTHCNVALLLWATFVLIIFITRKSWQGQPNPNSKPKTGNLSWNIAMIPDLSSTFCKCRYRAGLQILRMPVYEWFVCIIIKKHGTAQHEIGGLRYVCLQNYWDKQEKVSKGSLN